MITGEALFIVIGVIILMICMFYIGRTIGYSDGRISAFKEALVDLKQHRRLVKRKIGALQSTLHLEEKE